MVARSELIAIGRLQADSIEYIPERNEQTQSGRATYRAQLAITEVLKGQSVERIIPIVLHHGLRPIIGSYDTRGLFIPHPHEDGAGTTADILGVFDTGSSASSPYPLVHNAADDNIWFLRRHSTTNDPHPAEADLGIVDPEELRPVELKSYFMAYLSDNPEPEILRHYMVMWDTQRRAHRYLDHLAVERIRNSGDVAKRLPALKELYLRRQHWNGTSETRDTILSCGEAAVPMLTTMLEDPALSEHHADIISMLREINHAGAVPQLIGILSSHNQFWQTTPIVNGRYYRGTNPQDEETRHRVFQETYHLARALRELADPRAQEVMRQTKNQWSQPAFQNDEIVRECDMFLDRLEDKPADLLTTNGASPCSPGGQNDN